MKEWRFPSNDYGENKGINDSGVATFRGTPLKSLAREICQNSLDAATGKTVLVEFNRFTIPTDEIPGKEVLRDTFNRCLDFWGSQKAKATREFFTEAIDAIGKPECAVLRVSDFYTTGLTGSRESINTDWTNLTKSSGASDKRGTAGGSFGIGKYAPFACSSFSTVFYSTYDINEERASQGVARLVTFTRRDQQNTQGTGYYGNEKNTPIFEELTLDPSFFRKEKQYGTDIFIVGYKYGNESWQKELIVSILDGFLGAIWNEQLEVNVGGIEIRKNNLDSIIEEYRDDLTGYTDEYYKVLTSDKTVWFDEDFFGLGHIRLGLLFDNQETPKRIAMIRRTGMKIMDKDRLPGHVPFMGLMFINGKELNARLRAIENPEHTKWEPARSQRPNEAKVLLRSLNDYIKSRIEELINTGSNESLDAVGVGNFIPDLDDRKDEGREEVISDRVIDVEVKRVTHKTNDRARGGSNETDYEKTAEGQMEPEGVDEEWFHPGGATKDRSPKAGQPAHSIPEGTDSIAGRKNVGISQFTCICVNKEQGKYVIKLVPDESAENGSIELFLSAETQRYPVPIKSITLIGGSVSWQENRIFDLRFIGGHEMRFSLELDYYDYCSMEVSVYAIKE